MKFACRVGGTALCFLLVSCGLETIESLPAPAVTPYASQTDFSRLLLQHDPARFSGTNFQGYEIFYKIYPSAAGAFTNLVADTGTLANGPREKLLGMGYQRLNSSLDISAVEPLVNIDTALTAPQQLVLDFSAFLSAIPTDANAAPPQLKYTSNPSKSFPLYRSVTRGGAPAYVTFNELSYPPASVFSLESDMVSTTTADVTAFEVDVFIASYSFSPDLISTYSPPVPWGIIGEIRKGS